jgi:hypothetical protein
VLNELSNQRFCKHKLYQHILSGKGQLQKSLIAENANLTRQSDDLITKTRLEDPVVT